MAITSFQHFLKAAKPKPLEYIQFLQLLLKGVGLHAAAGVGEEVKHFRSKLLAIAESFTELTSSPEFLVGLGAALQALEDQSRRAADTMKAHALELQAMLGMMSETIAFLANSNTLGVEQLQAIEAHLETASDIDDVRLSRLKLFECLTVVRNESTRLREDSTKHIEALNKTIDSTQRKMRSGSSSVDSVTGLRKRNDAEQMIATKIEEGKTVTVALILIDRFASINDRFGRKVGDEILLMVAQHLVPKLPSKTMLFQWSGPAFLAMIDLNENSSFTDRQIRQVASMRLEKNIEGSDRSVLLPISCSVVLEKITSRSSAVAVCESLDKSGASLGGVGLLSSFP